VRNVLFLHSADGSPSPSKSIEVFISYYRAPFSDEFPAVPALNPWVFLFSPLPFAQHFSPFFPRWDVRRAVVVPRSGVGEAPPPAFCRNSLFPSFDFLRQAVPLQTAYAHQFLPTFTGGGPRDRRRSCKIFGLLALRAQSISPIPQYLLGYALWFSRALRSAWL